MFPPLPLNAVKVWLQTGLEAAVSTYLESENAATPLGKESIPAPRMFLARLKTDADMLDLSASSPATFAFGDVIVQGGGISVKIGDRTSLNVQSKRLNHSYGEHHTTHGEHHIFAVGYGGLEWEHCFVAGFNQVPEGCAQGARAADRHLSSTLLGVVRCLSSRGGNGTFLGEHRT